MVAETTVKVVFKQRNEINAVEHAVSQSTCSQEIVKKTANINAKNLAVKVTQRTSHRKNNNNFLIFAVLLV